MGGNATPIPALRLFHFLCYTTRNETCTQSSCDSFYYHSCRRLGRRYFDTYHSPFAYRSYVRLPHWRVNLPARIHCARLATSYLSTHAISYHSAIGAVVRPCGTKTGACFFTSWNLIGIRSFCHWYHYSKSSSSFFLTRF